jgi:MATE family multidrug resistance protein
MAIRIWSAPAAIALFGITGWLIAAERTGAVLVLQVWMNGLNMVLDVIFVLRPFWNAWPRIFDRARLWTMALVNRDILLRSLCLEAIFVSFLFFGAGFGDVPLAANQILLQFLHVTAYALDGFAFSAETLVGNAFGAKNPTRLRRAAKLTSLWGLIVVILFALGVWAFGPAVINLMTTSEPVREAAKALLPWMVAAPLLGIAAWMLDGIFIGATRTADMRNMAFVSTLVYFAAVWAFQDYGNDGLWMALLVSFTARGLTLGLRYPALERAARP